MKKFSDVFKSIRFAKLDPQHDKPEVGGSKDDEEHYTVGTKEWDQQVKHVKKRAMQEEKKDKYDEGEYDREGDMAKSDLRSIIANAKRLHDMIEDADNLPEWVQSKITVAEDYISTVANYMTAEMNESVADTHSKLRKKSGLPHPDYYKELGKSYDIEDDKERLSKQSEIKKKYKVESYVPSPHAKPVPKKPKGEYERKVDKYLKKKYNKEEVEIDEAAKWRSTSVAKKVTDPDDESSRSYDYHHENPRSTGMKQATSDKPYSSGSLMTRPKAQVASQGARKGMVTKQHAASLKDRIKSVMRKEEVEQIQELSKSTLGSYVKKAAKDSVVQGFAMGDNVANKNWKAGSKASNAAGNRVKGVARATDRLTKEDTENIQEGRPSQRHPLEGHEYHKKSNAELIGIAKDAHAAAEAMKGHSPQSENKYRDQANDSATVRYFRQKSGMPNWYKKKYGHVKEEMEQLEEKNVPTSPEKWAQAKAQAKAKFDVYPSAYANGWASKKYKEMGGGWKSVSEETISESRKSEIIKKLVKKKTNSQDKFEPNPVMVKTRDDRDH